MHSRSEINSIIIDVSHNVQYFVDESVDSYKGVQFRKKIVSVVVAPVLNGNRLKKQIQNEPIRIEL